MRIYLAGRYGRRKELAEYAERLHRLGHQVTSRWLYGAHEMIDERPAPEEARRFAEEDLVDLQNANLLIAFTEAPGPVAGRGRGGRHVELGYALASGLPVYVVGHRENVFCHLPEIRQFDHFETLYERLRAEATETVRA